MLMIFWAKQKIYPFLRKGFPIRHPELMAHDGFLLQPLPLRKHNPLELGSHALNTCQTLNVQQQQCLLHKCRKLPFL